MLGRLSVVTSNNNAQQLQQILGEDATVDPDKYRIDVIEFASLNTIEPKKGEVKGGVKTHYDPHPEAARSLS